MEELLKRIQKVDKKLVTGHLFKTKTTEVLFAQVQEKYNMETKAGREVKRILKKIVELGKNCSQFEGEVS